ncbi:MAG: hypothetical protein ABID38_06155 [Candidatus Diapherotrites archaeon]
MDALVNTARKNCKLCSGRRYLEAKNEHKALAQGAVNELYDFYLDEYNRLRKEDASVREINAAFENKKLCLDAVSQCNGCNKEIDRINRFIVHLI